MPSIGVSDDVKKKLNILKNIDGYKNVNEIIEKLLVLYEKAKFIKASSIFINKLKEKQINFSDFIKDEELKVIYPGE